MAREPREIGGAPFDILGMGGVDVFAQYFAQLMIKK